MVDVDGLEYSILLVYFILQGVSHLNFGHEMEKYYLLMLMQPVGTSRPYTDFKN